MSDKMYGSNFSFWYNCGQVCRMMVVVLAFQKGPITTAVVAAGWGRCGGQLSVWIPLLASIRFTLGSNGSNRAQKYDSITFIPIHTVLLSSSFIFILFSSPILLSKQQTTLLLAKHVQKSKKQKTWIRNLKMRREEGAKAQIENDFDAGVWLEKTRIQQKAKAYTLVSESWGHLSHEPQKGCAVAGVLEGRARIVAVEIGRLEGIKEVKCLVFLPFYRKAM